MARRRARKANVRQHQQTALRRPMGSGGSWRYWVVLAIVVLLAVVMVVTTLPTQ